MNEGVASLRYLSSVRQGASGGLQSRYSTQYGREGCSTRVRSRLLPSLPCLSSPPPPPLPSPPPPPPASTPVPGEPARTLRRRGSRCAEGPRRPLAAAPHHEAPQQGGGAALAGAGRTAAGSAVLARPRRSRAPGFPVRPEAAPPPRHAPVPTRPPEPGAFLGAAGRRSPRRRPLRPRPRVGRPRAASREKLARRPGEARSLHSLPPELWIHLAVVACGNRLEETLVMLKSAVLFSHRKMRFHIFTEDALKPEFDKQLRQWPDSYTKKFEHKLYPITFSVGNPQEWKKLFKPCAAQRLFLPVILKDVDSLLYVDTDVLFLRPVDDIWKLLRQFNSTQLAAMAPEHEIPKIGWYSRFARHPFYGSAGVNSGVMLMNLTRIRSTQFKNSLIPTGLAWEDMLLPLYQKYKNAITWGDQDLLNIIFYFNPECLYLFPCQWNYRPDHCMYGSNCKEAEREGVSVLHGNRGVYHDDKQPTFRALYEAIRDFPFQDNLFQSMYYPLQLKFLETVHTLCGRIPQVFLKQIEKTMRRAYEKHVIIYMGPNSMS